MSKTVANFNYRDDSSIIDLKGRTHNIRNLLMESWKEGNSSAEEEPREWSDLIAAEAEVKKFLEEIGQIIASGGKHSELERRIFDTYVPKLEEAQRREEKALDTWLLFVRREIK